MSNKYYRFYLQESPNAELLNIIQDLLLKDELQLGIKRVSFDLKSTRPSLSILCQKDAQDATEKQRINQFLLENKLVLREETEEESFEEEHCHHHSADHQHAHDSHHHHHHHHHQENHWLKAALGIVWGVGLLVFALFTFNIPLVATYIIAGLSSALTLFLGYKTYQEAWKNIKDKKWDMSILYTISTLTIVSVSVLSFFIPGLPMILESAPLILGTWHLGEAIEHSLLDKINNKLDVRDCTPSSVLLKNTQQKTCKVKELIPNDVIEIKDKEVIPVDGILLKPALLYTTRINGSPYPKAFEAGDAVKAGMSLANSASSLDMMVTKSYANSYLSLVAKNIEQANKKKAPIEKFANKILGYFIPGLLAVAVVSSIVISIFFPPAIAIQCLIAVLVSACPCALSLITPMAVKIGMKKSAEQGVHFKNGKALQAAANIDTLVFDLNGTLTQGKILVEKINTTSNTVLPYIALLESRSDHPIAQAIHAHIKEQNIDFDDSLVLTDLDKSHHSGIKGKINGEQWIIGNQDILAQNGIHTINAPYNNSKKGSIYVVKGSEIVGQIALTDPLREDAIVTINQFKAQGKNIHICTGADKATAEKYAEMLGIPKTNICANAVGVAAKAGEISKSSYLTELKKKGNKVAMIGDAANDIPAIATAHIGIAVRSGIGDPSTEQQAGMVLEKGKLFPIATAFDVAKKTKQNILQNLFLSLTYNTAVTLVAAGLFVAVGFALNPAIGVALMVLESTLVLMNLYRLKQQKTLTPVIDKVNSKQTESHNLMLQSLNQQPQPAPGIVLQKEKTAVAPPSFWKTPAKNIARFFANTPSKSEDAPISNSRQKLSPSMN